MYQLNSRDIKLFSKLYSGVIYDALIFDLNYKKPFLLDSSIKKFLETTKIMLGQHLHALVE